MTFEWELRQNNIDPVNDLNIDTSIAFAAMSGAFIGGQEILSLYLNLMLYKLKNKD